MHSHHKMIINIYHTEPKLSNEVAECPWLLLSFYIACTAITIINNNNNNNNDDNDNNNNNVQGLT